MTSAPTGTVTFLFTDIEGSTRLWDSHPLEMAQAVEIHDQLVRQSVEAHGGHVFSTAGDSFTTAFHRPARGF
jgi:class 3 adenylate cyclase